MKMALTVSEGVELLEGVALWEEVWALRFQNVHARPSLSVCLSDYR